MPEFIVAAFKVESKLCICQKYVDQVDLICVGQKSSFHFFFQAGQIITMCQLGRGILHHSHCDKKVELNMISKIKKALCENNI